jgi:hypothetical protein
MSGHSFWLSGQEKIMKAFWDHSSQQINKCLSHECSQDIKITRGIQPHELWSNKDESQLFWDYERCMGLYLEFEGPAWIQQPWRRRGWCDHGSWYVDLFFPSLETISFNVLSLYSTLNKLLLLKKKKKKKKSC